MSTKIIRENFYEELGMNKYDFFVKVADYIGDFPSIINEFYVDHQSDGYGEYLYLSINTIDYEVDKETLKILKEIPGSIYAFYSEEDEIEVYYEWEEFLHYFLTYYMSNIHCYADMISFIEQELIKYSKYKNEFKDYSVNLNLENIFKRDKLRNFLLNYNIEENKYTLGTINYYQKEIFYWDLSISKKFFSYLLGENILKEFLSKNKTKFIEKEKNFFGAYDGYEAIFNINEKGKKIEIIYYNWYLEVHERVKYFSSEKYGEFSNFISEKEAKKLIPERFKGKREKENIEVVPKEDFLKELKIIVDVYEDIYQDNEVQGMFEKYKEKLLSD